MSESDWSATDVDTTTAVACGGEINAHLIHLMSDLTRNARCTRRKVRRESVGNAQYERGAVTAFFSTPRLTHSAEVYVPSRATKHSRNAAVPSAGVTMQARPAPKGSLHDALYAALEADASKDAAPIAPDALNKIVVRIIECVRKGQDRAETAGALLRGLRDPLNTQLRHDVRSGAITPEAFVSMDDEGLLNPELRRQHRAARLARLEQSTVEYWQQMNSTLTNLFTCPMCNGQECYANFRSTDFVKWQGDDPTPTLLTCKNCKHSFRA